MSYSSRHNLDSPQHSGEANRGGAKGPNNRPPRGEREGYEARKKSRGQQRHPTTPSAQRGSGKGPSKGPSQRPPGVSSSDWSAYMSGAKTSL